jgi:hypothetical protein
MSLVHGNAARSLPVAVMWRNMSSVTWRSIILAVLANKLIFFATLENLDHNVDINSAWESVTENFVSSAKEILYYY